MFTLFLQSSSETNEVHSYFTKKNVLQNMKIDNNSIVFEFDEFEALFLLSSLLSLVQLHIPIIKTHNKAAAIIAEITMIKFFFVFKIPIKTP